jgi:hypothetical protein
MADEPRIPQVEALPMFRSVKDVRAFKIRELREAIDSTPGAFRVSIVPDDPAIPSVSVPAAWVTRHNPQEGGYFVRYEDGYCSYSPPAAFEDGYIRIEQWGIPRTQEPKYTVNRHGHIINRETGKEIPPDEPVMMFRGQDPYAMQLIEQYRDSLPPAEQAPRHERVLAFSGFAAAWPERMKPRA